MSANQDIQIADDMRGAHSLHPVVMPLSRCGMCAGRGVNNNGSECEHCDCGFVDVPFDWIARREAGLSAMNPTYRGFVAA